MAKSIGVGVAITLSATDLASPTIAGMASNAERSLGKIDNGRLGRGMSGRAIAAAGAIAYGVKQAADVVIDAYMGQEAALARLRIMEMDRGIVNESRFEKEKKFITDLSASYAGSIEEYAKMAVVLRQYRMSADDVENGAGDAAAKLGMALEISADKSAAFFGKMKNDGRVATSEMGKLSTMLYKVHNLGVGDGSGEATVTEMTQFFGRDGLAAQNLGLFGVENMTKLGLLGGMFMTKAVSGQVAGTGISKIFDNVSDPKKLVKVNAAAETVGIHVNFMDAAGKFGGIDNMVAQFAKLQNLNPEQLHSILDPFTGKAGRTLEMEKFMTAFGQIDFRDFKKSYGELATLDQAIRELTTTMKLKKQVTDTNKTNLYAEIGHSLSPIWGDINDVINAAAKGLAGFVHNHQQLTGDVAGIAAIGGSWAVIASGIGAVGYVLPGVSATLLGFFTGPVGIGIAALAASFLIIKNAAVSLDKYAKEHPESLQAKNDAYLNKRIADPNISGIDHGFARFSKAAHGFSNAIPFIGEAMYPYITSDLSKKLEHTGSKYWNDKYSKFDDYGNLMPQSQRNATNGYNGGTTTINYNPVVNVTGTGDNRKDLEDSLARHKDVILDIVNKNTQRNSSLKYAGQ
jgi:TP901 family phage tail tape measure protein